VVAGGALLVLLVVGGLDVLFRWLEPGEVGTAVIWVVLGTALAIFVVRTDRRIKIRDQERAEAGLPPDSDHFYWTGTGS
jgi:hypothetical protein